MDVKEALSFGDLIKTLRKQKKISQQELSAKLGVHPETAQMLYSLAVLRQKQGKLEEAVASYRRVLSIQEQTLGAEHPQTVKTRTGYAALSDPLL